jgi:YD repeat-containing protein
MKHSQFKARKRGAMALSLLLLFALQAPALAGAIWGQFSWGNASWDGTTQSLTQYTYDPLGRLTTETTPAGTTTYNYDPAGNRSSVTPGVAAPTGTFTASPASITAGVSTTLTWTSSGGTGVSIDHGIGNVNPVSGGSVTITPGQTTTYKLTISGSGGVTTTRLVTVSLNVPPPPPTANLIADPSSIVRGATATLQWASVNATTTSIDNGINAVTPAPGGALTVTPITTSTYTLTASGPGGTATSTRTITVNPPPSGNLVANPSGIAPGDASTLSWTSANSNAAGIDNGIGAVTPISGGSVTVQPSATTTYTLTLNGASGSTATSTATVTVSAVNHAPVATADELDISGDSKQYVTQCFDPRTNDTDQDGDTLSIIGITQPSPVYATATFTSTQVCVSAYVYNRSTNMTYTISDGRGGQATGTITIVITSNT